MILGGLLLSACSPSAGVFPVPTLFGVENSPTPPPPTPTPFQPLPPTQASQAVALAPTPVVVPTPAASPVSASSIEPTAPPSTAALWIGPGVPDALRAAAEGWGLPLVDDPDAATLRLEVAQPGEEALSEWVYALVAPFPTVTDGVTGEDLRRAWAGEATGPFAGRPLLMDGVTRAALSAMWGEPGAGVVRVVEGGRLVDEAGGEMPSWGIVPFEALEPRWKVLLVDGGSPIRKGFDPSVYPLVVPFTLRGPGLSGFRPVGLPVTNRDPEKLTTVVLTGVTALVRATAARMEQLGVLYPARDIAPWLQEADILHISNEIPFFDQCPPPNPNQDNLVFCSDPKYIELLEYIGTDVVELTGNHFQDYGSQATLETLAMYDGRQWPYYGGGADLEDSRQPAILDHNGNRLAFIGCNSVGPEYAWATPTRPGAAPCGDYQWMKDEVARLRAEGYLVIATFQYTEYYQSKVSPEHEEDFRAIAEAGATIVSGSQAHFPQALEIYHGAFIHYGLGNLFFDQMDIPEWGTRREFLDRHIFYDGRYLGTELLTAMLEDYARPRPMTPEERESLLTTIFAVSDWTVAFP